MKQVTNLPVSKRATNMEDSVKYCKSAQEENSLGKIWKDITVVEKAGGMSSFYKEVNRFWEYAVINSWIQGGNGWIQGGDPCL